ncbi:RNA polymerase sigma factor, partial [Phytohabitans suffuscus]
MATVPEMDDRSLVAAMVAGDPRGLDGAYRRYAPRLYAYCRSILHDADRAADAVQDTFVIAGRRAGQLREPERLLPWLYAVARHECLRQIRDRRREAPAELDDASADTADLGAGLRAAEARELVHAAAAGLGDGDREVIELALRHGLSAADVGAVLGVPANHAHARLSRARAQLERALGVLLVARAGACPALQDLLPAPPAGPPAPPAGRPAQPAGPPASPAGQPAPAGPPASPAGRPAPFAGEPAPAGRPASPAGEPAPAGPPASPAGRPAPFAGQPAPAGPPASLAGRPAPAGLPAPAARGWDGRLTPLLRKRLGRHVDGCARCLASRGALLSPAALLSGYLAAPFTVLPAATWRPAGPPDVPLRRDGFPARRGRGTVAAAAGAA